MHKSFLLGLVVAVVICSVAFGAAKRITLKNGQKVEGEVTETQDGYDVKTKAGLTVSVPKGDVASIEDVQGPAEEFNTRLAKVDPNSAKDYYDLGVWANQNDLLQQSRQVLQSALKIKPDYEQASLLLRQVEAKIALGTAKAGPTVKPTEKPGVTAVAGDNGGVIKNEMLVSEQDIFHIRLEELRESDVVSIEFKNRLIERFIEYMHGRREFKEQGADDRFRSLPAAKQVRIILRNIDRDDMAFKDDIIIKRDPKFMVDFRSRVWPIVAQNCATAVCHGGAKPVGGLKFFNAAGMTDAMYYTNFLIMHGLRTGNHRIINRDLPDMSVLLQYSLPPEQARLNHARPITPPFPSRKDPAYLRILEWITALNTEPQLNYHVTWKPPFDMNIDLSGKPTSLEETIEPPPPPPASEPASGPASQPASSPFGGGGPG